MLCVVLCCVVFCVVKCVYYLCFVCFVIKNVDDAFKCFAIFPTSAIFPTADLNGNRAWSGHIQKSIEEKRVLA